MSHAERTGNRSLLYSGWHRPASFARYMSRVAAAKVCMIDIDACEYCCQCREPLALIETQVSDRPPKYAPVMSRLAEMAGIPAFSVSVVPDGQLTVALMYVQQLVPHRGPVETMEPAEYAHWLRSLRVGHPCENAA